MRISPLRIAFSALASLAMATSANAAAILQFRQTDPNTTPILANNTTTTTTITTQGFGTPPQAGVVAPNPPGWVPVNINLLGTPGPGIQAFMSFTQPLTSGAPATLTGTTISQDSYTGTIQFNSAAGGGGINYLTATFNGGLLTGTANGNQASFGASQPPNSVTFTSSDPFVAAALAAEAGRNFTIGFSGLTQPLAIVGTTVRGFGASAAGTFSTTPAVPEPSSLLMTGIPALVGLGFVGFRRRSLAS